MYRLLVTIAPIVPLSGCGTALGGRWESWRHEHRLPSHTINCSGKGHTWDHCHRRAADHCGVKKYIIITLTGDDGVAVSASRRHRVAKSKKHRSMKIRCR